MVDNQHRQIAGYRDFPQETIAQINECKALSELIGNKIAKLREDSNVDQRWLSIAATDLQKGFMALVRSIAKPTTFLLLLAPLLGGCEVVAGMLAHPIGEVIRAVALE